MPSNAAIDFVRNAVRDLDQQDMRDVVAALSITPGAAPVDINVVAKAIAPHVPVNSGFHDGLLGRNFPEGFHAEDVNLIMYIARAAVSAIFTASPDILRKSLTESGHPAAETDDRPAAFDPGPSR
jgi:hypothetical protein